MALPLIWRVVAVLAALAAVLGIVAYGVHQIKADAQAQTQAAEAQQVARDMAAARQKEQALQAAQQESDREATTFNTRAAADRDAAAGASVRLQQRFAAINGCTVPPGASADAPGPAASSAADMRAYVLRRVAEAAGSIASAADSFHGAGLDAQQQHAAAVAP